MDSLDERIKGIAENFMNERDQPLSPHLLCTLDDKDISNLSRPCTTEDVERTIREEIKQLSTEVRAKIIERLEDVLPIVCTLENLRVRIQGHIEGRYDTDKL